MRKSFVGGNWKMNGTSASLTDLTQTMCQRFSSKSSMAEVILFPSFVYLPMIRSLLSGSAIKLGGQNLSEQLRGAFTGEISAAMLKDVGCQYVLVGHSERRHLYHESAELVAQKTKQALEHQLMPVLCVGETQQEREAGKTEPVILAQLEPVIMEVGIEAFKQMIVAYEPVWAIGTGLTASPDQAQTVHRFIRDSLAKLSAPIAESLRIVYGGSVKPGNAKALFAQSDIDGGLIGGASLKADDFFNICQSF
jgi:triosephosphate isomerase